MPTKITKNGQINYYQALTHACQCVGSRWAHTWAHYVSYLNGICYQRVTYASKSKVQFFKCFIDKYLCNIIIK